MQVAVTAAPRAEGAASAGMVGAAEPSTMRVLVDVHRPRQTLLGVGGALTQASARALSALPAERRAEVLGALFGPDGARYSLVRTHVASCDFSDGRYTYAAEPHPTLASFSVEVDEENGHLDLLRDARAVPGADFRVMASPWTAPPWMKDNGAYYEPEARRGGRLLEAHHDTFALYMARYIEAYRAKGVPIWAITVVNEPHGNAGTWESMEMDPSQQADVVKALGRCFAARGLDVEILVYDQNRREAFDFVAPILRDPAARPHVAGAAVHWYDSTFRVYEKELERLHAAFPDCPILQTEGCIDNVFGKGADRGPDAPLPWWKDDGWYWRKEATDWGWDWAENPEVDHPKYAPAFRYARDLVGGFAHWIAGWIDWNVVLDKRGGPNHVGNFCLAPILVDPATHDVYYTPLFHILKQVSRATRPGARVFATEVDAAGVWATGLRNPDGSAVVHLFNETTRDHVADVHFGAKGHRVRCPSRSLVTLGDLEEA